SLVVSTETVQPATGVVATEGTGLSVGNATSTLVVEAVSLSVGTRNAIRASPPGCAGPPWMVTWALAADPKPSTATAVTAPATSTARQVFPMIILSLLDGYRRRHRGLVEVRDPQRETELPAPRVRQRHRAGGVRLGEREQGHVDRLDALCRQCRARLPLLDRQRRALRGEGVQVHLVVADPGGFDVELELVQLRGQRGGVDALVGGI